MARKGPIKIPGRGERIKPQHDYEFIESMTKILLKDVTLDLDCREWGAIRVWREEKDLGPFELSNQDLRDKAAEFHPMYGREIAQALALMPRVTAVEWVNQFGDGVVIYTEW
jgi:hypothetical protein